jgi:hypothetical protein
VLVREKARPIRIIERELLLLRSRAFRTEVAPSGGVSGGRNLDGGFAASTYLVTQFVDGGSANSVYTADQLYDGGPA